MACCFFAVPFALSSTVSVSSFEVIYLCFGLIFLVTEECHKQFLFFIVRLASPNGTVYQLVFLLCVESVVPGAVYGASLIHEM